MDNIGNLDLDSYLTPSDTRDETLITLPTSKIIIKAQARKEFKEINELAQTIKKEGQLQRVIVSPSDKDGNHELIAGERRVRALKLLNRDVDCLIKDTKNALVIQYVENDSRKDLNYIENAEHLSAMQQYYQVSNNDLAIMVSRNVSYISRYLKIANASDDFKDLCKTANIKSISVADNLNKVFSKDEKLAKRIVKNGLTREILDKAIKNIKKGKSTRTKKTEKPNSPILGCKVNGEVIEVNIYNGNVIKDGYGNVIDALFNDLVVTGAK